MMSYMTYLFKKICQGIPCRETVVPDRIVTSCKQTKTEMLKITKTEIICEKVIFYYTKCMWHFLKPVMVGYPYARFGQ